MGNGSTKQGDAVADKWRDEFAKNRAARRRARAALDSLQDDDDVEDTQRIKALMADSKTPAVAKNVVGIMAVFPQQHRWVAFGILTVLVLGLVALGAGKLLHAF